MLPGSHRLLQEEEEEEVAGGHVFMIGPYLSFFSFADTI